MSPSNHNETLKRLIQENAETHRALGVIEVQCKVAESIGITPPTRALESLKETVARQTVRIQEIVDAAAGPG